MSDDYTEKQSDMDPTSSGGTALQPVSGDRVNQQRDQAARPSSREDARDSLVLDKISQFNSLAMQSKQLERKTADAALKRAMLGREEAEGEMRRYRDETRALRKQVEEGKERERRVGERLETVMENYGRAKETHAHTQALWEKEIRRARKETFKSQSAIVKLQEELKSARSAIKSTEEMLDLEKERSKTREQEAFAARYSLVGVQEQFEQTLERLKVLEQERDAFKALAKNEEDIARIAAEGRLPLPPSESSPEEDEFASPKKSRVSISIADVTSSATSEAEIDELTWLWQREKQRADRALEHVDFLEAECQLRCCACAKSRSRSSTLGQASARRKRPDPLTLADAGDLVILSEDAQASSVDTNASPSPKKSKTDMLRTEQPTEVRRSTIFIPTEGIFRTVSQEEAGALEAAVAPRDHDVEEASTEPPTPVDPNPNPPCYARTPSVDPPAFAVVTEQRTSLLSLLNAPHRGEDSRAVLNIPVTPGPTPAKRMEMKKHEPKQSADADDDDDDNDNDTPIQRTPLAAITNQVNNRQQPAFAAKAEVEAEADLDLDLDLDLHDTRPHTTAGFYTTTTKVPLREENADPSLAARLLLEQQQQRTPSASSSEGRTFDATNPALTPTMTREQALAQIRERRGRARSAAAAQGSTTSAATTTPRRQMVVGLVERRDVSAPAGRVGKVPSVVRGARS